MLITADQQTEMPQIFDPTTSHDAKYRQSCNNVSQIVVRSAGLEPARVLPHSDLNAARLPIPPRPLAIGIDSGAYRNDQKDSRAV